MKKRIVSLSLVIVILSSMILSAAAVEARATYTPQLSFSGTTATCYFSATAIGKSITATLELWHGNSLIDSWTDTATTRLIISETERVTPGQTYTLKVSGTIGGVPFTGTPVSGTC